MCNLNFFNFSLRELTKLFLFGLTVFLHSCSSLSPLNSVKNKEIENNVNEVVEMEKEIIKQRDLANQEFNKSETVYGGALGGALGGAVIFGVGSAIAWFFCAMTGPVGITVGVIGTLCGLGGGAVRDSWKRSDLLRESINKFQRIELDARDLKEKALKESSKIEEMLRKYTEELGKIRDRIDEKREAKSKLVSISIDSLQENERNILNEDLKKLDDELDNLRNRRREKIKLIDDTNIDLDSVNEASNRISDNIKSIQEIQSNFLKKHK